MAIGEFPGQPAVKRSPDKPPELADGIQSLLLPSCSNGSIKD